MSSKPLTQPKTASAPGADGRLPANRKKNPLTESIRRYGWLYMFVIPTLLYVLLFHYVPMGGVITEVVQELLLLPVCRYHHPQYPGHLPVRSGNLPPGHHHGADLQ